VEVVAIVREVMLAVPLAAVVFPHQLQAALTLKPQPSAPIGKRGTK